MRFAMNHIAAPKLALDDFFAMARRLGATEVEIRNDLPDVVGTRDPSEVRAAAEAAGVTILSINALYPFNVWSGDLPARAVALADYAAATLIKEKTLLVVSSPADAHAEERKAARVAVRNRGKAKNGKIY